jgi:hypothetical protein
VLFVRGVVSLEDASVSWPLRRGDVAYWQILLQKSAAADGPVGHSLRAAGFDPPATTPSTQLQRYAKHKA